MNKLSEKALGLLAHFKIYGMLYKEFMLLVRMKKTPILILSLPLLLLIIYSAGSSALNNPQSIINAGVCNYDHNALGVIDSITGNFNVHVLNYTDCTTQLMNDVKNGKYLIGFVIPEDFTSKIGNERQGVINYYVDDSNPLTAGLSGYYLEQGFNTYSSNVVSSAQDNLKAMSGSARDKLNTINSILNTTSSFIDSNQAMLNIIYPLINSYLKNALNDMNDYDRDLSFVQNLSVNFLTKPVTFNRQLIYTKANNASFNFPAVYVIISLFTLLLLASSGVIFDRKTNYLTRIKATKTFTPTYLLSKIVFYTIISLAQLILVMGLMALQGAMFNFDFGSLILSILIVTILNTSIGLFIGALSENENIAILSSLMLSLPFIFLSGVFFPIEFMPDYMKAIAQAVPLYNEVTLVKQAGILGSSIQALSGLMTNLSIISAILLVLTYAAIKIKK